MSGEREEGKFLSMSVRAHLSLLRSFPAISNFLLDTVSQNLVTRPHLITSGVGKCGLLPLYIEVPYNANVIIKINNEKRTI